MKPLHDVYRSLLLIRRADEEVARLYPSDKIQSPVHLSIGQELASVAVCSALRPGDKVFGTYRSHALYLAKGGSTLGFFAELYGKATGCNKGKGGSMHLADASIGLLGTSAIVGSLIPVAVGFAWAQKRKNTGVLTACFFGDGACEEGAFFESLNFAALHDLPILFVCENNGLAIVSPLHQRQATPIASRADALGVRGYTVAGFEGVLRCADLLVGENGLARRHPAMLEVFSSRHREHVGPNEDWDQGYRSIDPAVDRADPLFLAAAGLSIAEVQRIRVSVEAEIAEAIDFAEKSPFPEPEELMADTYS